MIIQHTSKGFAAHCFRDREHGGFVPHGVLSLAEIAARHRTTEQLQQEPFKLPADFTYTIPVHAMEWLLRAGVGYNTASIYRFGFSESLNRVILPVFDKGEIVAFTSRSLDKAVTPKYIAKYKQGYENVVFRSEPSHILPSCAELDLFDAVVVEDQLSAVRVGRVQNAVALLGTTISGKELEVLRGLSQSPRIAVWLDGDKAGRKGRDRVSTGLSLAGASVTKITTERDPKRYSAREIRSILENARYGTPSLDEGA